MREFGEIIKAVITLLLLLGWVSYLVAQSPANLNVDVNPSHGFISISAIQNTFNNGRRQEEIQLGLPANSINNLSLPSEWDTLSDEAKMLYLLNDERIARAGINYGAGPVKGLPFAGVAAGVDNVSNNYAQTLFDNDAFTHNYNGTTTSGRLAASYSSSCREFISRSENLFVAVNSVNTGFPRAVERAVYGFNYDDAVSNWGHREMNLLQDRDLAGGSSGFTDNEGAMGSEGYIGVGVHRGMNYGGLGPQNWPYGVILVLNYIDPSPACSYNVIESGNFVPPVDPCTQTLSLTGSITGPLHASDKTITLGANATFNGPTTISSPDIIMSPGFSIPEGACIQLVDDGCAYTGTFSCDNNGANTGGGNNVNGSGSCNTPYEIVCGSTHTASNSTGSNLWNSYGSSSGWSGNELIYRITVPAGSSVSASISGLTGDLDFFLALSCSNSVVGSSTSVGNAIETINFNTSSGGSFYLIVDGWSGASSSFNLNVSCNAVKGTDISSTKRNSLIIKGNQATMVCIPQLETK